jgi:hypothetical protein
MESRFAWFAHPTPRLSPPWLVLTRLANIMTLRIITAATHIAVATVLTAVTHIAVVTVTTAL